MFWALKETIFRVFLFVFGKPQSLQRAWEVEGHIFFPATKLLSCCFSGLLKIFWFLSLMIKHPGKHPFHWHISFVLWIIAIADIQTPGMVLVETTCKAKCLQPQGFFLYCAYLILVAWLFPFSHAQMFYFRETHWGSKEGASPSLFIVVNPGSLSPVKYLTSFCKG